MTTILSLAFAPDGHLWAATDTALLRQTDHGWHSIPLPMASTIRYLPDRWWTTALAGAIAYSLDHGETWQATWIDQVESPILCLAASPSNAPRATMLAGTNGAGILRTTDGGKRWAVSNFGLHSFEVFALATAPDWSRRERVFAGTADGLYRSSGGGRAWKRTGLDGQVVQAIACSRDFTSNGLVLAGTETRGLHHSTDAGRTWHPVSGGLAEDESINVLVSTTRAGAEQWLLGTDSGQLWHSTNGQQWTRRWASPHGEAVFALAVQPDGTVFIGLNGGGLYRLADGDEAVKVDLA